ncbi:TBC1 domain family member 30 [Portunus trituberculatus]|uniref:TBC1 domain family member 30 n=1 Tax=Portunus trituberculatus TaxID=210409 RepID=A0A5B7E4A1_PORTR|nr:TBC1 domain family member 30 [Portunus trituberculatus]
MSFPSGACLPPFPPQSYRQSKTSTVDDQSDSDDTFFVPRPRRLACQGQLPSTSPPRSNGMVLISTTSRNLGDEFCDVSLENAGDVKGTAVSYGIKSENSNVRKNLRQIANKIRSGSKEHTADAIRPRCPPNPSRIRGTCGQMIDLPPFEAFGGREPDCACGNVCNERGFPCRTVCCPEKKPPQQPPHGSASPPSGYSTLSSLMRAADDVTYGDSDTATAGSDNGTHYSARRRRVSSSIGSVSTERSEGENKLGGENEAEIKPGTWRDEESLRKPSLVDGLLLSIYRNHQRYCSSSLGESDTMTEHSTTSEPAVTRYRRCIPSSATSSSSRVVLRRFRLQSKHVAELKLLVSSLEASLSGQCALLVRELKKRDKLRHRRDQRNDVVTAVLHALSQKRSVHMR